MRWSWGRTRRRIDCLIASARSWKKANRNTTIRIWALTLFHMIIFSKNYRLRNIIILGLNPSLNLKWPRKRWLLRMKTIILSGKIKWGANSTIPNLVNGFMKKALLIKTSIASITMLGIMTLFSLQKLLVMISISILTILTIEKSVPQRVKVKIDNDDHGRLKAWFIWDKDKKCKWLIHDTSLESKFATYFPLWQIHPKYIQSHRKLKNEKQQKLNSIVSLPKLEKSKQITREDIITSLRNGIRKKNLDRIYGKVKKVFSRSQSSEKIKSNRLNSMPSI